MDYNTLLLSHSIDANNCSQFETLSDDNETIIFIKLKANQRTCSKCSFTECNIKKYIINSLIVFKGNRLSNGPMEWINKRVKDLKHIMSGYRNTDRIYKRLKLIQNTEKG